MSESIEEVEETQKDPKKTDLMKISGNILTRINFKVAFLLFVISMVLFSDVFIESVLTKFEGSVDGDYTTTKGTMIQLVFMVMSYIVADLIVQYEIV